jgi:hypothetical protein
MSKAKRATPAQPTNRFLFLQRTQQRLADRGMRLLYLRDVLYPVVRIEAMVRERSRERMGELELTLLGLVNQGIGSIDSLAYFSGLAAHRLRSRLQVLVQLGLVELDANGDARLSSLGKLSRESGNMTTQSVRGLLLCGLTGRPLPAAAYDLPRNTAADLRGKRYLPNWLLPSQASLPLKHLDLSKVENKRQINLPDEATEILGVVAGSAEPVYLEALLILAGEGYGAQSVELQLPCETGCIDWLRKEQVLGLREPLGFAWKLTVPAALQAIGKHFEDLGFSVVSANIDGEGNPAITLRERPLAGTETPAWSTRGFLANVATATQPGQAVTTLKLAIGNSKRDVLDGRPLQLIAAPGSLLEQHADACAQLRRLEKLLRRIRDDQPRSEAATLVATLAARVDAKALVGLARRWNMVPCAELLEAALPAISME